MTKRQHESSRRSWGVTPPTRKGRRIGFVVALPGPVPPARGDARRTFLARRGAQSAERAYELFQESQKAVRSHIGDVELPFNDDRFGRISRQEAQRRKASWISVQGALIVGSLDLRNTTAAHRLLGVPPRSSLPGEDHAQEALKEAIGAYRDLNAPGMGEIKPASDAHWNMHLLAEYVSGLFGCFMRWDSQEEIWLDCCQVDRAHVPYGASPGFTSTILCSICRLDIADCIHHPDQPYPVSVEHYVAPDGASQCSVCHEPACDHVEGAVIEVQQGTLMVDRVIHETTITPNPREPRALIGELGFDPQPPAPKSPNAPLRCWRCLLPCEARG